MKTAIFSSGVLLAVAVQALTVGASDVVFMALGLLAGLCVMIPVMWHKDRIHTRELIRLSTDILEQKTADNEQHRKQQADMMIVMTRFIKQQTLSLITIAKEYKTDQHTISGKLYNLANDVKELRRK